jgi:hypothetical protein
VELRIADCGLRIVPCFVALVAALGACDSRSDGPAPPARLQPADVRGNGVVRGFVKFEGTPPVMNEIANRPCHDGATPLVEEFVVVGDDGGLANVFVSIEGVPAIDGSSLPPALLDQVNCRYVPHALGVCVGQPVRIRSSDPTMHNVHYTPDRNESRNFGMTRAGDEKTVTFTAAELVRVKCDVHPWMNATIGVFDHPFFAVTREDGRYEIANLPAGRYKLVAWHERYGKLEQQVEVNDAAPIEAHLTYKAP